MSKNVVIIDYGAGNIDSVKYAFKRLGVEAVLTADPARIKAADYVVFPGVGQAESAMKALKKAGLVNVIKGLTQPVLGICLGMQLLCNLSEEGSKGLGVFDVDVKKMKDGLKVPHMGWNTIKPAGSSLFKGIPADSYMYFVHSFYAPDCKQAIARSDYGQTFSAALQANNFYGCQFHPEKSGETGEQILKNFIEL